ncbi:reverse transcriptase domain-containing protein [Tanacetum coccineum]
MRFPDIPSTSIKLMLFPFSLEGSARIWLEKEPPRSILTWDDLVSKFINQFFPPSKTTNLRNEITRFQQRFDESFYEAWDRFNELHHGFSELHQLDTFYNALNANDQDSLNSAAGGNFLDKMPRECLRIIESKSKVRNSRNKAVVAKVSSNSSTPGISPDVAALTTEVSELKNMMKTMLIDKQKAQAPAPVKAVEQSCVTCGGAHSYRNCPATDGNVNRDNIQEYVSQAAAANFNQGNTNPRPPNRVSNQMAPPGFAPVQNNGQNRFNQNQNQGNNFNRGNNFQGFQNQVNHVPNQGFQNQPFQAHNNQFQQGIPSEITSYMKANESIVRNMQGQINEIRSTLTKQEENLWKNLNDDMQSILGSFFQNQASTSGTLPSNIIPNPKGEMKAITTRSGVAYEGPSIPTNPSPKRKYRSNPTSGYPISIPEPDVSTTLPKTNPIPESDIPKNLPKPNISYPSQHDDQKSRDKASNQMKKIFQIFQDLLFNISFADALLLMPRFAPTIKSLLMNKEKLLELAKIPLNENCSTMLLKKLPEKLGDPGKFLIPCNFPGMDEVLGFSNVIASGNPTPGYDPIVSNSSSTLTPFGDSDFLLLEEADAFLALADDPTSPEVDESYYDPEGDILILEALLNSDPSPPPNQGNYLPEIRKELKLCEAKTAKSSIDEPPEVELKDLPPHLEYAFLEDNNKFASHE